MTRADKIEEIVENEIEWGCNAKGRDACSKIEGSLNVKGCKSCVNKRIALAIDREFSVECEDEMNKAIIIQERWDAKQEVLDSVIKKMSSKLTPTGLKKVDKLFWWTRNRGTESFEYNDGYDEGIWECLGQIEQMKEKENE